jgi:hypothetical protein
MGLTAIKSEYRKDFSVAILTYRCYIDEDNFSNVRKRGNSIDLKPFRRISFQRLLFDCCTKELLHEKPFETVALKFWGYNFLNFFRELEILIL